MTLGLTVFLCATASSCVLTGAIRGYALRNKILDEPNARSLHTEPTPRGGGVAIVVALLASAAGLYFFGDLSPRVTVALFGAVPVAWIGWLDDRRSVSPIVRGCVHVVSAAWAVYWLGGMSRIEVGGHVLTLGVAGSVLAVTGIVWATNLYNFMDGIDGIAASEAVTVGAIGSALLAWGGAPELATVALATSGASLGFLVWNWSPARIFMGDAGSGVLGFWFGVLAVGSGNAGATPPTLWGLIAGVFVVDATITLVRRASRRERVHVAHRSHAYQRLVQSGWPHWKVTIGVIVINLALGAVAALGQWDPRYELLALGVGFLALGGVYWAVERRKPMV